MAELVRARARAERRRRRVDGIGVLVVAIVVSVLAITAPARPVGAAPAASSRSVGLSSVPSAAPFAVIGGWDLPDGMSEVAYPAGAALLVGGSVLVGWYNGFDPNGRGGLLKYSATGEHLELLDFGASEHFDVTPSNQIITSTDRLTSTGSVLSSHPEGDPAAAPDGSYFVATATSTNHYSSTGTFLGSFPSTDASDLAVLPSGDLVYVKSTTLTIRSPLGAILHSWSLPDASSSVVVDRRGQIHVGLNWIRAVEVYTADGTDLGQYDAGPGGDWMSDLASAPTGEIYTVMSGALSGTNNRVNRLIDPTTPLVDAVTPSKGTTAGGTSVAIQGAGLTGATGVTFGSTAASSFSIVSDVEILAVSPPAAGAGAVNVFVKNASGSSVAAKRSLFVYKAPVPPDPPSGTTATPGDASVIAAWAAPPSDGGSPITGYTATANPGGNTCTTAGPLTCTITGLTNGTAHTVTVTATNAIGTGLPSAPSAAVTPRTVPGAPTAVVATAGDAEVAVTWAAPVSSGGAPITGYTATATPGGQTCTWTTGPLTCTITSLTNGLPLTVTILATNAAGPGPASAPSAPVTPRTTPDAPTTVTGTPGNGQVTVTWTAPADDGGTPITGYTATATPGGQTCTWTTGPLTCTIAGLTNGTPITVTVLATNAAGPGPASAPSAPVTPCTTPDAPTTITGTPGNGQVTVTWTAPADDGGAPITGYTATATPGGQTCTWTTGPLTCTITSLTNGTPITVTVLATNVAGTGPASSPSPVLRPTRCGPAPTVGPFPDVAADHPFCADIEWLMAAGIGGGYADGTFRPTVAVSRQAMAAFLWRFDGQPANGLAEPFFADVPPTHPFYAAIQWMAESGLSTGSADPQGGKPLFKPADPVSRQAMAAFLWRDAGQPAATLVQPFFADVGTDDPFYAAIQWMADRGISLGTPTAGKPMYKPSNPVSRQAMAAFLHRLATILEPS